MRPESFHGCIIIPPISILKFGILRQKLMSFSEFPLSSGNILKLLLHRECSVQKLGFQLLPLRHDCHWINHSAVVKNFLLEFQEFSYHGFALRVQGGNWRIVMSRSLPAAHIEQVYMARRMGLKYVHAQQD